MDQLVSASTVLGDFKIHSLTFTSCGRNFGNSNFKATLLLQSIQNAELVNCSFHNNVGTTLIVYDTNITVAGNSEFTSNCEKFVTNSTCIGGGGITARNNNLTFTGNTTFTGNDGSAVISVTNCSLSSTGSIHFINNSNTGDSQHPAGAIWALASSLRFIGTSNFINNTAHHGHSGAICAFNNTSLNFNGTSNFINNSAYGGGAICATYNTYLNFTGTSNFIENLALAGGAIAAAYTVSLSFTGTSNFKDNVALLGGGAIAASDNVSLSFNGTSNFIKNSAPIGGAIAAARTVSLGFTAELATSFITHYQYTLGYLVVQFRHTTHH